MNTAAREADVLEAAEERRRRALYKWRRTKKVAYYTAFAVSAPFWIPLLLAGGNSLPKIWRQIKLEAPR